MLKNGDVCLQTPKHIRKHFILVCADVERETDRGRMREYEEEREKCVVANTLVTNETISPV